MAREDEQGLRCRNSWRPSDGPLSQRSLQQQHWAPEPPEPIGQSSRKTWTLQPDSTKSSHPLHRSASMTTANIDTMLASPAQSFKNPNLIPVIPRRSQPTKGSSLVGSPQQDEELTKESLPQIWHPLVDDLIRRTAHDYDLIMNYERDAEGGQRWLREDIATIRDVGKHLHTDIFALKRWQRVVAEQGDRDKKMMTQIKRDANFLKLLCERIRRTINQYEQKCELELLRDGIYAQDEDGNFYKTTAFRQHIGESSSYRDISRPATENANDEVTRDFYNHGDHFTHQVYYDGTESTRSRMTSKPAHQNTSRRDDKVLNGRVSKSHKEPPSDRKRRSPSSTPHNRTSDYNTYSEHSTSNKGQTRGRNNKSDRNGVSRRQAKRDRERGGHSSRTAGRLGKHMLHY